VDGGGGSSSAGVGGRGEGSSSWGIEGRLHQPQCQSKQEVCGYHTHLGLHINCDRSRRPSLAAGALWGAVGGGGRVAAGAALAEKDRRGVCIAALRRQHVVEAAAELVAALAYLQCHYRHMRICFLAGGEGLTGEIALLADHARRRIAVIIRCLNSLIDNEQALQ